MLERRPAVGTQPSRKSIPTWLAVVFFCIVWAAIPWGLSLIGPRYGWDAGRPGPWNWLGLVPAAVGFAGSMWGMLMHSAGSKAGIDMEPDKDYLLQRGVYSYSRNPMYLFELTLMLGWIIFYGSLAVLIGSLVWWAWFQFSQIPMEEHILEKHFGGEYLEYKKHVRRWIGWK